jgi:hypothetical protein
VEYPAGQPADFSVGVVKNFQVAPGGTHTFTIDVDGRDVPLGEVRHATIVMRENGGQAADLRFPVTLLRTETPVPSPPSAPRRWWPARPSPTARSR